MGRWGVDTRVGIAEPAELLVRWQHRIAADLPAGDRRQLKELEPCLGDVIDTVAGCHDMAAAMRRFGTVLAGRGWHLESINEWVDLLAGLVAPDAAGPLQARESRSALARAWAAEYVRGTAMAGTIDPLTGLATMPALASRLGELFRHNELLGLDTQLTHTLVIAELAVEHLTVFDAHSMLAAAAATLSAVFHSGETICRTGARLIALCPDNETTSQRALQLEDELRIGPVTHRAPSFVWCERLPATARLIERFVDELEFPAATALAG
jgi:GGDEF domain-containing protein